MCGCEFPLTAPGILHMATLLIGVVCVTLGFMTHLHSSWVSKHEYKLCEDKEKYWNTTSTDVDCPDVSLETSFLVLVVICLTSSILWYCCELCCLGGSRTAALFYVIYLLLAAVGLVAAGILYIKSAVLIARLPKPEVMPVLENMGRVLVSAFSKNSSKPDDMNLTVQTDEQTYYQEKLLTGVLAIINGILHVLCAWLAVIDSKRNRPT